MKRIVLVCGALVLGLSFAASAEEGRPRRTPAEVVEKVFARLDKDRDQRISRQEGQAGRRVARHFDRLDADRDGFVTRQELLTAIEKHRAKRG